MKTKPLVGQKVFVLNIGNAARRQKQVLTPGIVTKVGRAYFSVQREGWSDATEYRLDSGCEKTQYTADSCVYESEQEWLDEKETRDIYAHLREVFGYNVTKQIPLSVLRTIDQLVKQLDQPGVSA